MLTLLFGGLRGSYSDLVLALKFADFSQDEFINQTAVNGVVTFEKAFKLRRESNGLNSSMAKRMGYGYNLEQAFSDHLEIDVSIKNKDQLLKLLEKKTPINLRLEKVKPNLVVIVMESFGSFWNHFDSKEFNLLGGMEKHFEQDYYFENFLSADNGTIGSLLTIITNIPNRPGARFLSESRYMQLEL